MEVLTPGTFLGDDVSSQSVGAKWQNYLECSDHWLDCADDSGSYVVCGGELKICVSGWHGRTADGTYRSLKARDGIIEAFDFGRRESRRSGALG